MCNPEMKGLDRNGIKQIVPHESETFFSELFIYTNSKWGYVTRNYELNYGGFNI